MAFWGLRQGATTWAPPTASEYLSTVTVTASATPHALGTWSELLASTADNVRGFLLTTSATASAGADTSTLLNIGIGGAGSEVTVLESLQVGFQFGENITYPGVDQAVVFPIPLALPSGVRVTACARSAVASKTVTMSLIPLYGAPMSGDSPVYGRATVYGVDTAASRGASALASGTNAKGSWVEMTASTTYDTHALLLNMATNTSMNNRIFNFDVGVGASGSEAVVVPDWLVVGGGGETAEVLPRVAPLANAIPAGSRIALRAGSPASNTFYPHLHAFTL